MEDDRAARYKRALKQVRECRNWYTHLFIYILVNTGVQLFYWGAFDGGTYSGYIPWWARFMMPSFWGVSLVIHYFYAFKPSLWENNVFKRWEEKKIQEYMLQDEQDYKSRLRKNVK